MNFSRKRGLALALLFLALAFVASTYYWGTSGVSSPALGGGSVSTGTASPGTTSPGTTTLPGISTSAADVFEAGLYAEPRKAVLDGCLAKGKERNEKMTVPECGVESKPTWAKGVAMTAGWGNGCALGERVGSDGTVRSESQRLSDCAELCKCSPADDSARNRRKATDYWTTKAKADIFGGRWVQPPYTNYPLPKTDTFSVAMSCNDKTNDGTSWPNVNSCFSGCVCASLGIDGSGNVRPEYSQYCNAYTAMPSTAVCNL